MTMHAYSTDAAERKHVPFFVAALAIGGSFAISRLVGYFGIDLPWWAPSVDTMALYGILYAAFDRWAWKLTNRIGLTKVPELSGKWRGSIVPAAQPRGVSSGLEAATKIAFTIRQTWTHLSIAGDTKHSRSHSV